MTNRFRSFLTGLLLLPVLASCDVLEPFIETLLEPKEPTYLKIDGRTLCEAFDTALTFDISCDISFTAEISGADWATITSAERNSDKTGGSVKLRFAFNTSEEPRAGEIVIKAGSSEVRKEFKQYGIADFFDPRNIELEGASGKKLTFTTPKPWTAKITEGKDWFIINPGSGTEGKAEIAVNPFDANENIGSRSGKIVVTIEGNNFEINVFQGQQDVIYALAPDHVADWRGGELSIPAEFNVPYDVIVSADWVHHISTKALNKAEEVFLIDEHPGEERRTADIVFAGKEDPDVKTTVTIAQDGLDNVLRQNTPGIYGVGGNSYILGADGWNHSSRSSHKDGSLIYRLMNPGDLSAIIVSGIDPSLEPGDEGSVHVIRKDKADVTLVEDYPVTLLGADGPLVWLKHSKDTYFIIQRQERQ